MIKPIQETVVKKRIKSIDALKAFGIFLVIWGHSLQYLNTEYDCFNNPLFEFIYSFHMPLFFLISGFFFSSSLKLNLKNFLYKKSVQLLLPIITWAALFFIVGIIINNEFNTLNWLKIPGDLFASRLGIWFLRELFISYILVYTSIKIFKKYWLAWLLSILFVLFEPFVLNTQRVFLPIFWVGFFLKEYYLIVQKNSKQLLIICTSIFVICLFFWKGDYTMYKTPFYSFINLEKFSFNLENIDIALFRLFIGLIGSLVFLLYI